MVRQFAGMLALGAALAVVAGGCGSGEPEGVKVTGSVMKGGQPLDNAVVSFISTLPLKDATPTRSASTNAEGKFEAKVLPGNYSVVLSKMVDQSGKVPGASDDPNLDYGQLQAEGKLQQVVPQQYTEPAATPLKVDIPEEGKDLEPFEISG
jgi:hypothetical protein